MAALRIIFFVVIWQSFLVLIGQCNSCAEEYELAIKCNSFSDLFSYPDPEKLTSVTISHNDSGNKTEDVFICDEPLFEKFKSVSFLTFTNARVLHISDDCFSGMSSIRAIDIQRNELTSINMEAFRATDDPQIQAIFLNSNHIVAIDFSGITFPELTQFEAYFNRIKFVKLKTENLPKVSNMYLGGNHISRFSIESQSMQKLDLSENRIKSFKGTDLILPNLFLIYLNDNHLTTITPNMLENMPNLESLYLAHNLLHTVSLPNLKKTSYMDFRYNRIKSMDKIDLTALEKNYAILFDSNKVFQMENQPPFENLISFTCSSCYIHIIDPFFFSETFKKLESISITSNFLTTANIFQKRTDHDFKLTDVTLSYNKIKRITNRDFIHLTKLTHLSLDNNDISSIAPGSFDKLENLNSLSISNNVLFQVSSNLFSKTTGLHVLSLSGNNMPFFDIPGWNKQTGEIVEKNTALNKLQLLNIYNNPLQCECIDLLQSWATKHNIFVRTTDRLAMNGVKPVCIVNEAGCQAVGKDFIKDYWHLFNDAKINDILAEEEE
ncbi:hypothetical protein DMENIID0001_168700 [Sergentomyia squamirostris]